MIKNHARVNPARAGDARLSKKERDLITEGSRRFPIHDSKDRKHINMDWYNARIELHIVSCNYWYSAWEYLIDCFMLLMLHFIVIHILTS